MNVRRSPPLPFFEHPLSVHVDLSTVIAVLTRQDYASSLDLDRATDRLQGRLRERGIDETRIAATLDIIAEFALNAYVHGRRVNPKHECVLVCLSEDDLNVVMLGEGPARAVMRMKKALESIREQVDPHDRRKLFAMRNELAWRNRHSPSRQGGGGGLGMLTVSALARDHLLFKQAPRNGETAFYVKSSI